MHNKNTSMDVDYNYMPLLKEKAKKSYSIHRKAHFICYHYSQSFVITFMN